MTQSAETDPRAIDTTRALKRTWLTWGLAPLTASALVMFTVGTVWANPIQADEHNIERGFQAVLAVCAALFLAAFWLDGRWTNSEGIARRIWQAAVGGEQIVPDRGRLAERADVAYASIRSSHSAIVAIGNAIAVAAIVSVCAGLSTAQGAQIILLGLGYQLFVLSRHPYYDELLLAASRGELVAPDSDANHNSTR